MFGRPTVRPVQLCTDQDYGPYYGPYPSDSLRALMSVMQSPLEKLAEDLKLRILSHSDPNSLQMATCSCLSIRDVMMRHGDALYKRFLAVSSNKTETTAKKTYAIENAIDTIRGGVKRPSIPMELKHLTALVSISLLRHTGTPRQVFGEPR